jgi:hypothetical protein
MEHYARLRERDEDLRRMMAPRWERDDFCPVEGTPHRYLRVVDLYDESRARQLRLSRQVVRAVLVVMLGVGAYLAAAWLVR